MATAGNHLNFIQKARHNTPVEADSPSQPEKGTFGTQDPQEAGERAN